MRLVQIKWGPLNTSRAFPSAALTAQLLLLLSSAQLRHVLHSSFLSDSSQFDEQGEAVRLRQANSLARVGRVCQARVKHGRRTPAAVVDSNSGRLVGWGRRLSMDFGPGFERAIKRDGLEANRLRSDQLLVPARQLRQRSSSSRHFE